MRWYHEGEVKVPGRPEGAHAEAIAAMNRSSAPVVAVDIPSGVNGETGAVDGEAAYALVTVTFGAAKLGVVLQRTTFGRMVRAVRVNPEMSLVIGVNPETIFLAVFAIGSFLGGIAAVFAAAKTAATPQMGFTPVFYAFTVAFLMAFRHGGANAGLCLIAAALAFGSLVYALCRAL